MSYSHASIVTRNERTPLPVQCAEWMSAHGTVTARPSIGPKTTLSHTAAHRGGSKLEEKPRSAFGANQQAADCVPRSKWFSPPGRNRTSRFEPRAQRHGYSKSAEDFRLSTGGEWRLGSRPQSPAKCMTCLQIAPGDCATYPQIYPRVGPAAPGFPRTIRHPAPNKKASTRLAFLLR